MLLWLTAAIRMWQQKRGDGKLKVPWVSLYLPMGKNYEASHILQSGLRFKNSSRRIWAWNSLPPCQLPLLITWWRRNLILNFDGVIYTFESLKAPMAESLCLCNFLWSFWSWTSQAWKLEDMERKGTLLSLTWWKVGSGKVTALFFRLTTFLTPRLCVAFVPWIYIFPEPSCRCCY
jgi:hypothetical protein